MESVGFKEWAIVCEALGRGEQSIVLRKGGIAEGRSGFAFQHSEFFLFPTFFHEQLQQTFPTGRAIPIRRVEEIEIQFWAKLEFGREVTSWPMAEALEPFHILQREVVRERFEYRKASGIHVAAIRIFRLCPRWIFPELSSYGGCRSWVRLPQLPEATRFEAVLSDEEHHQKLEHLAGILGNSALHAQG